MEQTASDGYSDTNQRRLSAEQNGHLFQEAFEPDGDISEVALEQLKNVASNGVSGTVYETVEIGMEINEIERANEPPESGIVASLEAINDDCLREILQYLDIMEIVKLATISERLLQFSKEVIFPKTAKEFSIVPSHSGYKLSVPSNSKSFDFLTLEDSETAFQYFGEYVEALTLKNVRSWGILTSCHNLKKLTLDSYTRQSHTSLTLQYQIERLQHLNELTFQYCKGTVEYWLVSDAISNVTNLTLKSTTHSANGHFIGSFKNLTILSLDLYANRWQFADIQRIMDNNSHCLKHLKVTNFENDYQYRSFARLITEKLHKLEYLQLDLHFTADQLLLPGDPLLF